MRARALLTVERVGGRSVVRELRSQSPLSLVPRRGTAAALDPAATVHLVGSATTPLGGDDVELTVHVGPGAELVLTGVAAAVALAGTSSLTVRFTLDEGASLQYLPEPTVITSRADHHTLLHADLHETARIRLREILVGGRAGEQPGRYRGTTRLTQLPNPCPERSVRDSPRPESAVRGDGCAPTPFPERLVRDLPRPESAVRGVGVGVPLLHQTQEFGDPALQSSSAVLAGNRVLGTEVLLWGPDGEAATGESWSLTPLARRGSLATAVGRDAVTTQRALAEAVAAHPGWTTATLHERHLREVPLPHGAVREVQAGPTTTEEAS